MCSIFYLPAGINIPEEKLFRAVANNPHGFGIILRDVKAKRLQVIREMKEETNYLDVKKILDDNIDLDRYVHLRWATVGEKVLDNVHPFTSYYSDSRHVEFMHNGTLSDFNSNNTTKYENGVEIPNPYKGWSDSRRFNDEIIMPLLLQIDAGNGKGDIKNPMTLKMINKFWSSYNSKGIMISSDQGHSLINESGWRFVSFEQEDGEVVKVLSSNDDYYDTISRGPEHERRLEKAKKEREEREAAERATRIPSSNSVTVVSSKFTTREIRSNTFAKIHGVTDELSGIGHFIVNDDAETLSRLAYMTSIEVEDLVNKRPNDAVSILISATNCLVDLLKSETSKKETIEILSRKVKSLRDSLGSLGVDYREVEKAA